MMKKGLMTGLSEGFCKEEKGGKKVEDLIYPQITQIFADLFLF